MKQMDETTKIPVFCCYNSTITLTNTDSFFCLLPAE